MFYQKTLTKNKKILLIGAILFVLGYLRTHSAYPLGTPLDSKYTPTQNPYTTVTTRKIKNSPSDIVNLIIKLLRMQESNLPASD